MKNKNGPNVFSTACYKLYIFYIYFGAEGELGGGWKFQFAISGCFLAGLVLYIGGGKGFCLILW